MTIYIDEPRQYALQSVKKTARKFGTRWSHLYTDGPAEELHQFAKELGLRREWYQTHVNPALCHYDVTPRLYQRALLMGAQTETPAQLYQRAHDTANKIRAERAEQK